MSSTPIDNNLSPIKTNSITFCNASVRFGKNTVEHLLVAPLKDTAFHLVLWRLFDINNLFCEQIRSLKSTRAPDFQRIGKKINDPIISFPPIFTPARIDRLQLLLTPYPLNKHFADETIRVLPKNAIVPSYHKNMDREIQGNQHVEINLSKGPIVRHLEHQINLLLFRPLGYIEKDLVGVSAEISKNIAKKAFSTFVVAPALNPGNLSPPFQV